MDKIIFLNKTALLIFLYATYFDFNQREIFFLFWFWGNTWRCSGITPVSALEDTPAGAQGTLGDAEMDTKKVSKPRK